MLILHQTKYNLTLRSRWIPRYGHLQVVSSISNEYTQRKHNISNLSSGLYFVTLDDGSGQSVSLKFVK
ncbi:MAG: T9SS type A sorting domain-containing protein [Saprospiraceae bacterium]|nr:T9SS type A sorting domain-containing protein [Saprospiraceae bacterium]